MKTTYTYAAACALLEVCASIAAIVICAGPYSDAERIAAILAPGVLGMALWGLGVLVPWVRRLRVEAQLQRAERTVARQKLEAIEAELRAANMARLRALVAAAGEWRRDAPSRLHHEAMIARVCQLEEARLDAIREMHTP